MSPRIREAKAVITKDLQGRMHIANGLGPQSPAVILKPAVAPQTQTEKTPMNITLHIEVDGLITADHSGNSSERIRELFNTTRIPTPFTFDRVSDVEHFGAVVITRIRELNPSATVTWSAERCEEFTAFKSCALARQSWK